MILLSIFTLSFFLVIIEQHVERLDRADPTLVERIDFVFSLMDPQNTGRATVRRARLFLETPGRIVRGGIKWYRGMAKGGLWARCAYRLVNMKYLRSNLRPPGLLLAPGTPAGAMEYVPGWPTHDGRRVTFKKASFELLDLGAPRKSP